MNRFSLLIVFLSSIAFVSAAPPPKATPDPSVHTQHDFKVAAKNIQFPVKEDRDVSVHTSDLKNLPDIHKPHLNNLAHNGIIMKINSMPSINNIEERSNSEFSGSDRSNSEFSGSDRSNSEFSGSDRSNSEFSVSDRSNSEFSVSDRSNSAFSVSDRSNSEFSVSDRSNSEFSVSDRSNSEFSVSDRSNSEFSGRIRSVINSQLPNNDNELYDTIYQQKILIESLESQIKALKVTEETLSTLVTNVRSSCQADFQICQQNQLPFDSNRVSKSEKSYFSNYFPSWGYESEHPIVSIPEAISFR